MNVLKWFFQICTSQDREVESHKAHILENGGSNPSPAINSFYAVSARAVYGSSGLNPWEKVDVYPDDCWAVRKTLSYVVQMEIISFIYRGDQPW